MLRLLFIALQSVGPTLTDPVKAIPIDMHVGDRCPDRSAKDDVVVCGRLDPNHYRLKPLPAGFERNAGVPKAELSLGNSKVSATTEQVMIGGVPSNRMMVSIKLPF